MLSSPLQKKSREALKIEQSSTYFLLRDCINLFVSLLNIIPYDTAEMTTETVWTGCSRYITEAHE